MYQDRADSRQHLNTVGATHNSVRLALNVEKVSLGWLKFSLDKAHPQWLIAGVVTATSSLSPSTTLNRRLWFTREKNNEKRTGDRGKGAGGSYRRR